MAEAGPLPTRISRHDQRFDVCLHETIELFEVDEVDNYRWAMKKGVLPELVRLEPHRRDGLLLAAGILLVMMIAFFQRRQELWFRSAWVPWGGIGVALTWGTIHLVPNPQGAVWVIIWGVPLGVFFVLSRKSFVTAWILGVVGVCPVM